MDIQFDQDNPIKDYVIAVARLEAMKAKVHCLYLKYYALGQHDRNSLRVSDDLLDNFPEAFPPDE